MDPELWFAPAVSHPELSLHFGNPGWDWDYSDPYKKVYLFFKATTKEHQDPKNPKYYALTFDTMPTPVNPFPPELE